MILVIVAIPFILGLSIYTRHPCPPLFESNWKEIPEQIIKQIKTSIAKDAVIGSIGACESNIYQLYFIPHFEENNYLKYYEANCSRYVDSYECHFYENTELRSGNRVITISNDMTPEDALDIQNYVYSLGSGEDKYNGNYEALNECGINVPITDISHIGYHSSDDYDSVTVYLEGRGGANRYLELVRVNCGMSKCKFILKDKKHWCNSVLLH